MTLLAYLLKVIVVSAIFYGYYRLFLRNKRFHHYNRFFLLSALLLSIVLPFIRIPLLYQPHDPINDAVYRTVSVINTDYEIDQVQQIAEPVPINESVFTLMNSIYLLYAIGVLFLLTLVFKSLLYIRSLRKRYPAEEITSLRFYNTHEPGTPFSFFRSIFWNDQLAFNSREGQQIFRHELFHVQHQHSADRLLSEFLTAIFWFNPFFHLIKKELKAIHEFLADQFAISDSDRYAYATLLVQQALEAGKHTVTNHFFQNHIKRRIAMITQFKQSKYGYWSRVMILPVAVLLFCFVTLYAKKPANPVANDTAFESGPSVTLTADTGGGDNGPDNRTIITQFKDTVPAKNAKERELLKVKEQQLMEIRRKMEIQEEMMRKLQQAELENLRRQMQEQETMSREVEKMKRNRDLELMELRKEIENRQKHSMNEYREQMQELERRMKEDGDKAGDSDEKKELIEKKQEVIKNAMREIKEKMEERQRILEQELRVKLREIEMQSQHQKSEQDKRSEQLRSMREKIMQREAEMKQQQKRELEKMREELKRDDEELKRKMEELKKQKDGSSKGPAGLNKREDSLLADVIRHFMHNVRYPKDAIENRAEGKLYFSILVDKKGKFKDFTLYNRIPEDKPVRDIVIVTDKLPFSVREEELSDEEKRELFRDELKRVSEKKLAGPIELDEECKYFFRAVFVRANQKSDNNFEVKNTSHWETEALVQNDFAADFEFQDTIPAKPGKMAKPGAIGKPGKPAMPKFGPRAKERTAGKDLKTSKLQNRKSELFKRKPEPGKETALFKRKPGGEKLFHKKPTRAKEARKPVKKLQKLPKTKPGKEDGSGQIPEEEENQETETTK